jgi:MHS family proline/betaine transporter-like MFS transporter
VSSLIAAFGAFAAGFLMRPFGSLVFGHIGDRVGRKAALICSILAMAVPTFLIGVMPTYDRIGVFASVLLVLLRLAQGLSVGGEYTTSVVFLIEQAGARGRGFFGSWSGFGSVGGMLLGSAVGAVVTTTLGRAATADWGWRVPFLLRAPLGLFGLYLRRTVSESMPSGPATVARSPVIEAFHREWRSMLKIAGFYVVNAIGFYMCFVYVTTYWRQIEHRSASTALDINTLSMTLLLVLIPLIGVLSDRTGRRPLLLGATAALVLLSWPLFWLMHQSNTGVILLGQAGFAVLFAITGAVGPTAMAEAFPREVRCSGLSVGYNACLALFGGTTPLIAVYLVRRTHNDLSPAFYVMAAAAISFAVIWHSRETAEAPLR